MSASEDLIKLEECVKITYPNYKRERVQENNVYCLQVTDYKGLVETAINVYAIGNEMFLLSSLDNDQTLNCKQVISHLKNLAK